MKNIIFAVLMFGCSSFASASSFSAFADGDNLYVTILTDTCNAHGVDLITDGICRSDRLTENYATECSGTLSVMATEMACGPGTKPQVFTLSLAGSMVAPEAEVLNIVYWGNTVSVKLKK